MICLCLVLFIYFILHRNLKLTVIQRQVTNQTTLRGTWNSEMFTSIIHPDQMLRYCKCNFTHITVKHVDHLLGKNVS